MTKAFSILITLTILLSCSNNEDTINKTNIITQATAICDTFPTDNPNAKDYKKALSTWLETTSLDWFLENRQSVWREARVWNINNISLDSNSMLKCLSEKQRNPFLYIPNHFYAIAKNGNEYFEFFIVNNTQDTLLLPMLDKVISNISSSISLRTNEDTLSQWLTFQKTDKNAACANSNLETKLPPQTAIKAQIESDYLNMGDITVHYRLELTLDKQRILSNSIRIKLMKKQLPFLRMSFD